MKKKERTTRTENTKSYREKLQGRTEDALASGGEEGRGKLRKGAGICQQELIRTCPNGGTRMDEVHTRRERTQGTETS